MTSVTQNKKDWTIGEQITIPLTNIGIFTATAQKVTDKGTLFIFDDYIARRKMNEKNTNEGGYEVSDLKRWIDTKLLAAFPEELRNDIYGLSIPTVGEFFGHEDDWDKDYFEPDEDEQLELMKLRKNRVAYFNNEIEWGWLRNTTCRVVSYPNFACVRHSGTADNSYASDSYGVRPEFWLVSKSERSCAQRTTEEPTVESLLNGISKKESEIQEMRNEIKRLEEVDLREEEAKKTKEAVDSFCEVGFTEHQAQIIVSAIISLNFPYPVNQNL